MPVPNRPTPRDLSEPTQGAFLILAGRSARLNGDADMAETRENTAQKKLSDEFHAMIGYCVAAWAQVDDELFRIFQQCVGLPGPSAIIYYRTPGLDARRNLTDEIVQTTLLPGGLKSGQHDTRLSAWRTAIKDFRDLLSVRRRIAHHHVGVRETGYIEEDYIEPGYFEPAESSFEIYVGAHERLRATAAKLPPLLIQDLRAHLKAVNALRDQLRDFFRDVLTRPAPKSGEPSQALQTDQGSEKGRPIAPRRQRKPSPR